jgi:hypothetical protein
MNAAYRRDGGNRHEQEGTGMKPQVRAVGLALAIVALLSGTVAAGHLASVTSYTGCLVSKDGVIIKIKAGEAPSSPCSGGMVQVHFSGGDITSISVTGALTGGGDNGAITIGLKPEFTLPTGCTSGEIAEWNGTGWVCGTDHDTTYSPGIGLEQEGTTFHIAPSYRVKNTPDCLDGEFATGFANSGTIICAAPPAPPAATQIKAYSVHLPGVVLLSGKETILSLNLPAGTYLLFATVDATNNDGDSNSNIECSLPTYTSTDFTLEQIGEESIALNSTITTSGGVVNLDCTEITADVRVIRATLQALKVDTIN